MTAVISEETIKSFLMSEIASGIGKPTPKNQAMVRGRMSMAIGITLKKAKIVIQELFGGRP